MPHIPRCRTLVVNKSDSYCGECGANVIGFYTIKKCEDCGAAFEYISSDYCGMDGIMKGTRPDLTWREPLS